MRKNTNLNSDEALWLAKAFMQQPKKTLLQKESKMWYGISKFLKDNFGIERSNDALRVKWQVPQRESQMFLPAQAQANGNRQSGMTEKNVKALVMYLYRKRVSKKDSNGIEQEAPPFNYMAAAKYLTTEPKFGGSGPVVSYDASVHTSLCFLRDDDRLESGESRTEGQLSGEKLQ